MTNFPRRNYGTESDFELATIQRLEDPNSLAYDYKNGGEILRNNDSEVLLKDNLTAFLEKKYPHLPEDAIKQIISKVSNIEGSRIEIRNKTFHELLSRGFEIKYKNNAGEEVFEHIYLVDFINPHANEFLVVNQLPIQGKSNDRRPDMIIFINGLPLILFELKNPNDEMATVQGAYNQIEHYVNDIPQLFDYNEIVIISDGGVVGEPTEETPRDHGTFHGMWSSDFEWFSPWKTIDGINIAPFKTGSMKTLLEGLFPKDRLLAYIRYFIIYEEVNDKIIKKGAKYHQFFAVRLAVQRAIEASRPKGDKKIGVIWHTQGAGKSLSMLFFSGLLRKADEMKNPTILIQVDRNDLDTQLHDQFVICESHIGKVKHAESVEELRGLLSSEGGEIIFSTIEKFQLKGEEEAHPTLSDRHNLIVIADEAHRTQYGTTVRFQKSAQNEIKRSQGFARSLREALPNASFIGFTGTPIDKADANTVEIFGNVIHVYDMKQSQEDGSTVPIYYEARIIPLKLTNEKLDAELDEITEGEEETALNQKKSRWAAIANAAGAKDRIATLAKDILAHYQKRCISNNGKALVICMTRKNCVALYDEMTALPGCPEVKIVMTGDLTKDPKAWSQAGHITTKRQRDKIKARMKDIDDPLKIVIVRDMWLTGTDIPCLHTLYIDKPMSGHNLMQAIARVNRVFSNKRGGVIVDYIGIGEELKEATKKYTGSGGKGNPTEDINIQAIVLFMEKRNQLKSQLPSKYDYSTWRTLKQIKLDDMLTEVFGTIIESDESKIKDFLDVENSMSGSYSLISHLDEMKKYADEVAFYQLIRNQVRKYIKGATGKITDKEKAVMDLIDRSISSEGVKDLFALAGLEAPDLSIITEEFIKNFKEDKITNLRIWQVRSIQI